jgi:diguanylate cyclase (GGDEF)-like protein
MDVDYPPLAWAAAAFAFGASLGLLVGRRGGGTAARAAAESRARDLAAAKEALAVAEERAIPADAANADLLVALGRAHADLAGAGDQDAVIAALVSAVERTFRPSQHMVFVAAGRESRDLVLSASAGAPWEAGARLGETMGRLGLVVRRRVAMCREQFESEAPVVREQVEATEPAGFVVDAAAPVVVDERVVAILSVGGSAMPADVTMRALDVLARHASTALRAAESAARLGRLRDTDPMTGLGSKGWFVAEGAEAVYGCRLDERPVSLVIVALDDFRAYAERCGHAAADRLLKAVADTLRPLAGEKSLLARWSGAEFLVLVPGATLREARVIADRVRGTISSRDWPGASGQPRGRLTACAGVAASSGAAQSLDDLIEVAANALSSARWSGDTTQAAEPDSGPREPATQEMLVSVPRGSGPATTA